MIFWEDCPSLILNMEINCERFHAVFMKLYTNRLQKLLSALRIFWNCQNITEDNRRQNCLVSVPLSLIYNSLAPTNFTFSVRLGVFKALLWAARDSSPKRNVEAAWPSLLRQGYSSESLDWQTAYFIQCKNTQR